MFRRHSSWPLAALLCVYASPGGADPESERWKAGVRFCSSVYANAVQLEQSGRLRQARDLLLTGAKARCIASVRKRCLYRYRQLESDIPSVIPVVTGEDGEPRVDVHVSIDSELLTSHLDGRSLPVDPGLHEFTFSIEGKVIANEKIMIAQGQRNQPISITMRPDKSGETAVSSPSGGAALDAKASQDKTATDRQEVEKREPEAAPRKAAPESAKPEKAKPEGSDSEGNASAAAHDDPGPRGPGAMPYVVGTVGFIGLAGAGLFTYWGRKDNELLARCAPDCSRDSVDHIQRMYVAADVSLGVGAAALATSVVWFLASAPSKQKPQAQTSHRFDLKPTPSGGVATFSGSF